MSVRGGPRVTAKSSSMRFVAPVPQQPNECLRREALGTQRWINPELLQFCARQSRYRVLELLAAPTETRRYKRSKRAELVWLDDRLQERDETNSRAPYLRRRCERSRRDGEQLLHPTYRLHANRQRAVRLAPRRRGQP